MRPCTDPTPNTSINAQKESLQDDNTDVGAHVYQASHETLDNKTKPVLEPANFEVLMAVQREQAEALGGKKALSGTIMERIIPVGKDPVSCFTPEQIQRIDLTPW